jgi:hypothetical protein
MGCLAGGFVFVGCSCIPLWFSVLILLWVVGLRVVFWVVCFVSDLLVVYFGVLVLPLIGLSAVVIGLFVGI